MSFGAKMRAAIVMIAALTAAGRVLSQQATGTLVGSVTDSASGRPLTSASVFVTGSSRGVASDVQGRFTFARLAAGAATIRVRAIGYRLAEVRVTIVSGDTTRVTIRLVPQPPSIDPMIVVGQFADREAFETSPVVGSERVTARTIDAVPSIGEPDVARVVQLMPGVAAPNDFSTSFNVRGGESDQNLVMLDGIPIYNPFHVGGLFSTFMDPTVRDVNLLTGAFPARYGGRLSSVLDVTSAEDARRGIHGTVETSVLASTAELGGAFAGGRGTWMLAGRRTYADQVARLVSKGGLPYHFRDEQFHATYDLGSHAALAVTLYDGRDVFDANLAALDDSAATGAGASNGTYLLAWGNRAAGVTLSKTFARARGSFADSVRIVQRAIATSFSSTVDVGAGSYDQSNHVADRGLAGSATLFRARQSLSAGYELTAHDIEYASTTAQTSASPARLAQHPTASALYVDDLWRPQPSMLVEAGARLESITGRGGALVSPRLSIKHFAQPDLAFAASVARVTQFTHSLGQEDNAVQLFQYWIASDANVPVSTAWHYLVGVERWIGAARYVRVDAFYKRYDNLLESSPGLDPATGIDALTPARGYSYGADVVARLLEAGPVSGWLSYTYALGSRVRDSLRYFPAQDRRHDLNIVGSWRFSGFVMGGRFGYASGTPYTPIVGEIVRRTYDPATGSWNDGGIQPGLEYVGGARSGARYPATQRLDIGLSRSFTWRGTEVAPYVSVANAYYAKNVLLYVYDYRVAPPTRESFSQFPILPSAGVTVRF